VEANGNHAAATVYLDKLAEELTNRGLEAWLMAPPGRVPSVYITNPGARALEENVYADCGKDGLWWFWWSWAERISMADDVDTAATVIARVLSLPRSALSPVARRPLRFGHTRQSRHKALVLRVRSAESRAVLKIVDI
jgi:hypothetical protein